MARARLRHLQLLVRTAELGNLQRAATSVHMSQPGATHALGELETVLGAPLFERHARGMRPTPMAAALLPLVRNAIAQLQAGAEAAAAVHAGAAGSVRVAAIGAAMSGLVAPLLPGFTVQHPDVAVDVRPASADELLRLMEERSVDLLACRAPEQLPADLEFLPLVQDRYAVVCGPQHPLVAAQPVGTAQLGTATWLLPPPSGLAARDFDRLCGLLGIAPPVCWVTGRAVLLTLAMLQQRELLVLLPRNVVVQLLQAGLLVELACSAEMTPAMPPVGLVVPRDQARCSAGVVQFIAHAQRWAQAHPLPAPGVD
ncbi:hypothetical protein ASF45_22115 [Pseudorhodoferax sp. Leaf265]|jgi:DNA-binding transcriptional LysR family regulator|nr:hypothetical protein ASF45_22115 [Pseudorhodoferax sp. Leaf265]